MPGLARITVFVALLGALFAAALAAGSAVDPDVGGDEPAADAHAPAPAEEHGGEPDAPDGAGSTQRGLAVAQDGLRLVAAHETFPLGRTRAYSFRIERDGAIPVTNFEVEHERRMHVIVVRRDLTGYQHLHPRMAADGTWSVDLRLDEPGVYRVYADFQRGGEPATLATDLTVAGDYRPRTLPEPEHVATTGPYTVELGDAAGEASFTVTRAGRPVEVEPYLGARGHLVVLREGDLAYLHVHPEDEATEGREIGFGVEYPSAGRYRMFLQFKHDGRVHTAAFTKETSDGDEH